MFGEPVDPVRLSAYLAEPDHDLMVAIHDGVVIAQVAAEPFVMYVYVL